MILTKEENTLKKLCLLVTLICVLTLSGCSTTGTTPTNSPAAQTLTPSDTSAKATEQVTEAGKAAGQVGSGVVGDYAVSIDSARKTTDYDGKPAIIITYTWTNNSSETTSAAVSLYLKAFQSGAACDTAIVTDDKTYKSEDYMRDIKPGTTLTVEEAFLLRDETSAVEAELTGFLSEGNEVVTKTFDIT